MSFGLVTPEANTRLQALKAGETKHCKLAISVRSLIVLSSDVMVTVPYVRQSVCMQLLRNVYIYSKYDHQSQGKVT